MLSRRIVARGVPLAVLAACTPAQQEGEALTSANASPFVGKWRGIAKPGDHTTELVVNADGTVTFMYDNWSAPLQSSRKVGQALVLRWFNQGYSVVTVTRNPGSDTLAWAYSGRFGDKTSTLSKV